MAVSITTFREAALHGGQSGWVEVIGTGTFTTTSTTGDLPCRLGHIESISFTPLVAPNSNEIIYVDSSGILNSGVLTPGATLPIGRTGTATSGLPFAFRYVGY